MTETRPHWLVISSRGWTLEASSEWAAGSVAKLHPTPGCYGRARDPPEGEGPPSRGCPSNAR